MRWATALRGSAIGSGDSSSYSYVAFDNISNHSASHSPSAIAETLAYLYIVLNLKGIWVSPEIRVLSTGTLPQAGQTLNLADFSVFFPIARRSSHVFSTSFDWRPLLVYYRATLYASARRAVLCCHRVSVRPFTTRCCAKTAKSRITKTTLYSRRTLCYASIFLYDTMGVCPGGSSATAET